MIDCPECGEVEHQPIPEDSAHCGCQLVSAYMYSADDTKRGTYLAHWDMAEDLECDCPCHGPIWLGDASVPDVIPD